jgi:Thiamine pyrophosphate enzyme, C-terminal TPP binding domain
VRGREPRRRSDCHDERPAAAAAAAATEDLPVVVVILDNGGLGMVHQWQMVEWPGR